jgi:uncharacterized protein (DUF1330 family)
MSALLIARFSVKNADKLKEYAAQAPQTMVPFGGEALFRGKADKTLTGGDNDHVMAAIFKFPSLEKIDEWYNSEAYEPLKAIRDEGADFRITSYEVMP